MPKTKTEEVPVDRRRQEDRRQEGNRRQQSEPVAVERRESDRRKVPRRRQIDPTTCERDYSTDEIEFMQALDAYKRTSGRMFPTCSEILEVIRDMGYVRMPVESDAKNSNPDNTGETASVAIATAQPAPDDITALGDTNLEA